MNVALKDVEAIKRDLRKVMLEVADTPLSGEYASKLTIELGNLFLKKIDEAPLVDAVEVVRCKDCIKHYDSKFGYVVCVWFNKIVRADGYCSHGERKMDAEVEG